MNRTRIAATALLLSVGLSLGLAPQVPTTSTTPATFKIDPVHSTAIFRVQHLGAGRFYGRFNDVTGTFRCTEGSADGMAFDVSIAIESVDSGNEKLDGHLKSPDFFNAREMPTMTFKSTAARKRGDGMYLVSGDLTLHGVTKKIEVPIEWAGSADFGRGLRCGFEAVFDVKRSDYGMEYMLSNGGLGDEVRVIVSLEGIKQ